MSRKAQEEEWEFLDDQETVEDDDKTSPGSEPGRPRRRNRRKVPLSSPFTRSFRERKPPSRMKPRPKPIPSTKSRWNEAMLTASMFTLRYVWEVLRFALDMLRKPLSLILVGYLLAVMALSLQATVGTTLSSALTPLCVLPGMSRVAFCHAPLRKDVAGAPQRADYPRLEEIQSATFERLLDDSVGGAGLALDIKKAEMATNDLATLVRNSQLTSRERMAVTLRAFVDDAKRTGRGLQKFSAKVAGAVDGVIAVNDYALKRIEAVVAANSSPSFWRSILVPFSGPSASALALTASFAQAMSVLESELQVLILAAEASLHDLDTLEEKLNLLHAIVSREDVSLNTSRRELLSKLWTMVGGNRSQLHNYDAHLRLLSGLAEYRQRALVHVVGALQTLQTMSADLEVLRERVAQPALMSEMIPLEVHVRSIRAGLERLTEGRQKAKRIEDAQYARLAASLKA